MPKDLKQPVGQLAKRPVQFVWKSAGNLPISVPRTIVHRQMSGIGPTLRSAGKNGLGKKCSIGTGTCSRPRETDGELGTRAASEGSADAQLAPHPAGEREWYAARSARARGAPRIHERQHSIASQNASSSSFGSVSVGSIIRAPETIEREVDRRWIETRSPSASSRCRECGRRAAVCLLSLNTTS